MGFRVVFGAGGCGFLGFSSGSCRVLGFIKFFLGLGLRVLIGFWVFGGLGFRVLIFGSCRVREGPKGFTTLLVCTGSGI